jgi:hypothetical protein
MNKRIILISNCNMAISKWNVIAGHTCDIPVSLNRRLFGEK